MRTETITQNIYTLAELTGSAREKALQYLREGVTDYDWFDFVYEDAKTISSIMGIDIDNIYFKGFCSQGDGACFDGRYKYKKGALKALKEYAPDTTFLNLCQRLQDLQKRYFYKITANISCNDRYMRTEGDYDINGRFFNPCIPDEVIDGMDQLFSEFADWIYKQLETEYDYITSEESLLENAESNGYEFDESGGMI
jgi:hypothetical protein